MDIMEEPTIWGWFFFVKLLKNAMYYNSLLF